jgi:hypothetical protein
MQKWDRKKEIAAQALGEKKRKGEKENIFSLQ